MRSFKVKLIGYFALLAIIPTCLAFYGFDTLGKRREMQRVDSRLRSDIRFAVAGYAQQIGGSERRAQPVPIAAAVERLRSDLDPRDTLLAVRDGASPLATSILRPPRKIVKNSVDNLLFLRYTFSGGCATPAVNSYELYA